MAVSVLKNPINEHIHNRSIYLSIYLGSARGVT